jgi:hypothetical protein
MRTQIDRTKDVADGKLLHWLPLLYFVSDGLYWMRRARGYSTMTGSPLWTFAKLGRLPVDWRAVQASCSTISGGLP